jgi:hypothetical protein
VDRNLLYLAKIVSPVAENQPIGNDVDWAEVIRLAQTHGLSSVLYNYLTKRNIQVEESIYTEFRKNAFARSMRMMQLASELPAVDKLLTDNGIAYISLKGPALALQVYGNLALKQSGDLDLWVEKHNVWTAFALLESIGYVQDSPAWALNETQKKYLVNSFHHLGMFHPEKKILLELHWQMNTNKFGNPFTFAEAWQQKQKVVIAEREIPVLGLQHSLLHQLVHGAGHQWGRLAWLRDMCAVAVLAQNDLNEIWSWCKANDYDRYFAQGLQLTESVFGFTLPPNLQAEIHQPQYTQLVDNALHNLQQSIENKADVQLGLQRLAYKTYLSRLRRSWQYKFQVWKVLGTNVNDWDVIHLPRQLYFMYFVLRPIIWLIRLYRRIAARRS